MIAAFSFYMQSEAKAIDYYFYGRELAKVDQNDGKKVRTIYCKDKFDIVQLGLSLYELVNVDDPSVVVSPDEKYFVFDGRADRNSDYRYFIADISECKIVRELAFNKADNAYAPFGHHAVFSADSKTLYISWRVWNDRNVHNRTRMGFDLTKEYSGVNFANERTLKNVVIPGKILTLDRVKFRYPYKFSQDGKSMVVATEEKNWNLSVYDLQKDEVSFRAKKIEDYVGAKKYFYGEDVPDISDGLLLFNFETTKGVEVNVFDYRSKMVENKIDVPEKGLGRFSSKGDSVIVSTFPDPKTLKKTVFVYERKTGKSRGRAILDASDEVEDISADGKQIIYKTSGKEIKIDLN